MTPWGMLYLLLVALGRMLMLALPTRKVSGLSGCYCWVYRARMTHVVLLTTLALIRVVIQ